MYKIFLCFFIILLNASIQSSFNEDTIFCANRVDLINQCIIKFSNYEARLIDKVLCESLSKKWYDQNAKLKISYIETKRGKLLKAIEFIGYGKIIKVNLNDIIKDLKITKLDQLLKFEIAAYLFSTAEMPMKLKNQIESILYKLNKNKRQLSKIQAIYTNELRLVALRLIDKRNYKETYFNYLNKLLYSNGLTVFSCEKKMCFPLKIGRISSHYGYRFHPILKKQLFHWGVDIAAPKNTKIYSAFKGKIIFVGYQKGYGNVIKIRHSKSLTTLYAHLNKFKKNLKVGQSIKKGSFIGYVGSTGYSSGNHLHFEVILFNKKVNPLKFKFMTNNILTKKEMDQFLEIKRKVCELLL